MVAAGSGAPIEVSRLFHHFELRGQSLVVLGGIDLHVRPGEFIAILGPSGCGKSTLLRLIAGLEKPRAGHISMDGKQVGGPHPSRILVFQDPTLFPWRTVQQNVALGLEIRGLLGRQRGRVRDMIRQVRLNGFENAYPHQLSGGMAQRAALARSLVNEPSALLMDEPLANLDSLTRIAMQEELAGLWQRKKFTALLVTHDVEEALCLAERVLVLSHRPAQVLSDITIDLPYPRHRTSPHFTELRLRVSQTLGLKVQ